MAQFCLTASEGVSTLVSNTRSTIPEDQGAAVLTARQQEIWNFLVEYVDRHGYPPTVREIGEEVGLPGRADAWVAQAKTLTAEAE